MEESDYDGRTALHLSSIEGHEEAVKFLLFKCNVNPNVKDRWDKTPSDDAKFSGYENIVSILEEASLSYKGKLSIKEDDEQED